MKLQKPKGTMDILPEESWKWQYVEGVAKEVFGRYNYKEIRTPIFEHIEVINRSVGETTDIVSKEMYDFHDKGGRHITLRPEGTAAVVRSFVENKLFAPEVPKPVKFYYTGPMFRYERPQSGRLRQFHQIGVECFGVHSAALDFEIIAMVDKFFKTLGLSGYTVNLNSLGTNESRAVYRQALIDYFTPFKDQLSEDSQRRLVENPLRVLDSKEECDKELAKNAPSILDYLNEDSAKFFKDICELMDASGIPYVVDDTIVRGLDYYADTIFEFVTTIDGQDLTICGGGRYDGLIDYFDGPSTPGVGFAIGVERLLLALELSGIKLPEPEGLDAYLVVLSDSIEKEVTELQEALRAQGYKVERDFLNRKIAQQFKTAETFKAKTVIVIGDEEVQNGKVSVRNNETHQEVEAKLSDLIKDFSPTFSEIMK